MKISSTSFQSELYTLRTEFYAEPVPESKCIWCGEKFIQNSHIFWECETARVFWKKYGENVQCDKEEFENAITSQMNSKDCFKADRQTISTSYHLKHLARLAKSYLLVCQKVGVLPLYAEHWCQMSATPNRLSTEGSSVGGYKTRWDRCPLPPPRGKF